VALSKQKQFFYEFGSFRVDPVNRLLFRNDELLPLQPKMFDTLLLLIENRGQLIQKDELMSRLWPDTVVEESNLTQNVYVLRKLLGNDPQGDRYIETIPKRGYRFTANVQEVRQQSEELILERQTISRIVVEEEAEIESPASLEELSIGANHNERMVRFDQPAIVPWGPGAATKNRKNIAFVAGTAAIIALAAVLWWTLRPSTRPDQGSAKPFQSTSISRLTDIGRVVFPTISRDGKYLAYVSLDDEERRSIWVKHIPTGSATQIVPTAPTVGYESLVFSLDGNYVYFNRNEKGAPYVLCQVPVLGGATRRLIEDVWGAVTFSPDGKRLAFVRAEWNKGEHSLIVADADGTNERTLATRRSPDYFNVFGLGPAWSPNGNTIACSGGNSSDDYQCLVEVRVDDGSEKSISSERWDSVGQLGWVGDGSGLVFFARKQPALPQQIWYLSYPDGALRSITNDLSAYEWLALTADSSIIVAQRGEQISNIWVAPSDGTTSGLARGGFTVDASRAKQITLGVGKNDGFYGLCWTPEDRIIYSSDVNGSRDLWITDADGTNQEQLTVGAGRFNSHPSVERNVRYIVFSSNRAGAQNIWRMDADGRNPKQLTHGRAEYRPSLSPDGRWIVYPSGDSSPRLWKVSIDGGEPQQLTDRQCTSPVLSPDGKLIAYGYFDEQMTPPWRIGIMSSEGGPMLNSFPAHFRGLVRWSVDAQSLMYIDDNNVSNIWSQPLTGGPPRRLTDFKEMRIYYFDWSRDGKWLACARGVVNTDAVMIRDLK
jgi:Tol biopolymer transport system component/DNA-binding winged helix-turn-helix (wHTH) protein